MWKKILLGGIVLGLLLISWGYYYLHYATTKNTDTVILEIPKGASLIKVSQQLQKRNLLGSARIFSSLVRLTHRKGFTIQKGEYEINPRTPISQVLSMLSHGKRKPYKITIPEGLTTYEILQMLLNNQILIGEISGVI